MTLFGWDASHYDGLLSTAILARAKAEGIIWFTHKVGEGTSIDDPNDKTALAAARDAGIEFVGGYGVVRSGDIAAEVDYLLGLADRDEPWWRTFTGWFWQVDLERWSYDNVSAATGIAYARLLRQRTGRCVVLYASRGQYGDYLTGWDGPLWNAAYGTNPVGDFRSVYPGDGSSRWAPYSGQVPAFLQYGSNAIIAALTTCDANAYRGTLDQLRALITGGAAMTDQMTSIAIYGGTSMGPPVPDPVADDPTLRPDGSGRYHNSLVDLLQHIRVAVEAARDSAKTAAERPYIDPVAAAAALASSPEFLPRLIDGLATKMPASDLTAEQVRAIVREEIDKTRLAGT